MTRSHLDDLSHGDLLAKQSDVTVGGDAVPPGTEYFGFALYIGSAVSFLCYLLWAYLPRPVLHWINVYYYPSRWWALAIPAYIGVTVGYIYVALACYNTEVLTKKQGDLNTVTDGMAKIVPARRGDEFSRRNSRIEERFSRRNSRIDEVNRNSAPVTPTLSRSTSPYTSPNSTTNLLSFPPPPSSNLSLNHYLFNPSDGVWDLPLSEVCAVLYN